MAAGLQSYRRQNVDASRTDIAGELQFDKHRIQVHGAFFSHNTTASQQLGIFPQEFREQYHVVDDAWTSLSGVYEDRVQEIEENMLWPDENNPKLLKALEILHSHWETRAKAMIRLELAWPVLLDVDPWETSLEVSSCCEGGEPHRRVLCSDSHAVCMGIGAPHKAGELWDWGPLGQVLFLVSDLPS